MSSVLARNEAQFSALDRALLACLTRHCGPIEDLARLAIAACSHAVAQGHSCLPLQALADGFVAGEAAQAGIAWPRALEDWQDVLQHCAALGAVGSDAPLILHDGRLYLRRYFEYERAVAAALTARANQAPRPLAAADVAARLDQLFGDPGSTVADWQRAAVALAVRNKLSVILGGPGSGKTYSVLRLFALLQVFAAGDPPRIALAAPTGKAAARVSEALRQSNTGPVGDIAHWAGPPPATLTLHRLLGVSPYSTRARFGPDARLPYDIVVVDECSMVDLPRMAQLLAALPDTAQLVLLGDPDQLASVEAGSVLAELRALNPHNQYGASTAAWLKDAAALVAQPSVATQPAIADCVITLQDSRRFAASSGIATLIAAVRDGDSEKALQTLRTDPPLVLRPIGPDSRTREELAERCLHQLADVGASADAELALHALARFRLLLARREGGLGVTAINREIARAYLGVGPGRLSALPYAGLPVLITANDYDLGLFNGDLGVYWPRQGVESELRVWFPQAAAAHRKDESSAPERSMRVRDLLPAELPAHEMCYAMTVHKAQGSEFDSVLLVLPSGSLLGLSREWLYTALSRARERIEIWGDAETLRAVIALRAQRWSGLAAALSGAACATQNQRQ